MEGLLKPKGSFRGKKAEEKSVIGGVAAGKEAKIVPVVNFDEEDEEDFEDISEQDLS